MSFPTTRQQTLEAAQAYVEHVPRYAKRRNFVTLDGPEVSRLSPLLRHRVISEMEWVNMVNENLEPSLSEKFRQEIYWRFYWKSYLEKRPEIWTRWQDALATVDDDAWERSEQVASGNSGVGVMDAFANQLVETGYLHNHARMWFAAFWIHRQKLPWELGARFFLQHLLDGDPASNTLSWRWVAGLHTKGKTYLVRRSNLEKYLEPAFLEKYPKGLEQLNDATAEAVPVEWDGPFPERKVAEYALSSDQSESLGLWLHEDDLGFESTSLAALKPKAVMVCTHRQYWDDLGVSEKKKRFLNDLAADAGKRAESHFECPVTVSSSRNRPQALAGWAADHGISKVVTLRPFVGAGAEGWDALESSLSVPLEMISRPEDQQLLPLATAGFFGFWKKAQRLLGQ